jgi:hypothetical protein
MGMLIKAAKSFEAGIRAELRSCAIRGLAARI